MTLLLILISLLQPLNDYEAAYKMHVNKEHHSALSFINSELRWKETGKALALKLRILSELQMINVLDAHKMYVRAKKLDDTIPSKSCVIWLKDCQDVDYRFIKNAHKHNIRIEQ